MAKNNSRMPAPPNKAVLEDNPEAAPQPVLDLDGNSEDLDAASEPAPVAIPKPLPKKKIKVEANRAGFIHNHRKVGGDKFEVYEHELGSWMDCEDPVEQKKHLERMKAKKQKVNRQAIQDHKDEIAAGD
jgi:hypothetical protein